MWHNSFGESDGLGTSKCIKTISFFAKDLRITLRLVRQVIHAFG